MPATSTAACCSRVLDSLFEKSPSRSAVCGHDQVGIFGVLSQGRGSLSSVVAVRQEGRNPWSLSPPFENREEWGSHILVGWASPPPFHLTTRKPYKLIAGTIQKNCDVTYGYMDFLNYTVQDQLFVALPDGGPVNEHWTTTIFYDYNGTNWRRGAEGGFSTAGAGAPFADQIGGENLSLPPTPTPTCNTGTSPKVEHWGQEWWFGSLMPGVGVRVQTDTLQKYKDYADHESIVSPAP